MSKDDGFPRSIPRWRAHARCSHEACGAAAPSEPSRRFRRRSAWRSAAPRSRRRRSARRSCRRSSAKRSSLFLAGDYKACQVAFGRAAAEAPRAGLAARAAYGAACCAAVRNDVDGGFEAIGLALANGFVDLERALTDPRLDTLRADSRWFRLAHPHRGAPAGAPEDARSRPPAALPRTADGARRAGPRSAGRRGNRRATPARSRRARLSSSAPRRGASRPGTWLKRDG